MPLALPDILPPGHKRVDHRVSIETPSDLRGTRLVIGPLSGFGGYELVVPGGEYPISSKYGTRLHGVPDGSELPAKLSREWALELPSSAVFPEISSVTLASPLAKVRTSYRVTRADDTGVQVERIAEVRLDAQGHELAGFPGVAVMGLVAALGLAGLVALSRSRRTSVARESAH